MMILIAVIGKRRGRPCKKPKISMTPESTLTLFPLRKVAPQKMFCQFYGKLFVYDVFIGGSFKMEKFFKDLVVFADDDERGLEDVVNADPVQKVDDLLRILRKKVYKKRSMGMVRR